MSVSAQDMTKIQRFISCTEEYYNLAKDPATRPEEEYYFDETLYAVNNGTEISIDSDEEYIAYSDMYYGARKFTDIFVTPNYPGDETYPNDKLYLVPEYDISIPTYTTDESTTSSIIGFRVYFKHKDQVVLLASSSGSGIDAGALIDLLENNSDVQETVTDVVYNYPIENNKSIKQMISNIEIDMYYSDQDGGSLVINTSSNTATSETNSNTTNESNTDNGNTGESSEGNGSNNGSHSEHIGDASDDNSGSSSGIIDDPSTPM